MNLPVALPKIDVNVFFAPTPTFQNPDPTYIPAVKKDSTPLPVCPIPFEMAIKTLKLSYSEPAICIACPAAKFVTVAIPNNNPTDCDTVNTFPAMVNALKVPFTIPPATPPKPYAKPTAAPISEAFPISHQFHVLKSQFQSPQLYACLATSIPKPKAKPTPVAIS